MNSTPHPDDVLLDVRHLTTRFRTPRGLLTAVDDVSLRVKRGQTLGLVGESGSGKSVTMRSVMQLLPHHAVVGDDAEICFEGLDLRALDAVQGRHFWGTSIAIVLQDPMTSLNPVKTVGRQLTEGLRFHLELDRSAARAEALELLNRVGIAEPERRMRQFPHELSGGMRQRVVIAIALSCSPKLLIADEPTTALDVTVQKQILDLLGSIQRDTGMSMVLITHDLGVVAGYTDETAVMYAGQIVEQASTDELFRNVRHPYSEALLASIPRADLPSNVRLDAIPGRPPDLVSPHEGCRFAPRCQYRTTACVEQPPPLLVDEEPPHAYRCLAPLGGTTTGGQR